MRKLTLTVVITVLGLSALLAASCGGAGGSTPAPSQTFTPTPTNDSPNPPDPTTPPPPGDLAAQGKEIFLTGPADQPLWCFQCHQIEGVSEGLVGPDLTHVGTDGAARKPGMSAEDYIRESITDPEAFLCPSDVQRCTAGLMTTAVTAGLTDDQVDALVAFLMKQE